VYRLQDVLEHGFAEEVVEADAQEGESDAAVAKRDLGFHLL
jgi:hypothetical protein